jgi:hypothetical protein
MLDATVERSEADEEEVIDNHQTGFKLGTVNSLGIQHITVVNHMTD